MLQFLFLRELISLHVTNFVQLAWVNTVYKEIWAEVVENTPYSVWVGFLTNRIAEIRDVRQNFDWSIFVNSSPDILTFWCYSVHCTSKTRVRFQLLQYYSWIHMFVAVFGFYRSTGSFTCTLNCSTRVCCEQYRMYSYSSVPRAHTILTLWLIWGFRTAIGLDLKNDCGLILESHTKKAKGKVC